MLGTGSYGKVFLAENKTMPDHKVAIKIISKEKLTQAQIQDIRSEVAILSSLDHPHIVKYYETYEDVKYLYLVMEYCTQGDLM